MHAVDKHISWFTFICACMDLLESYNTSSSSSDSEKSELGRRDIRKVYLITYSQANTSKIPTRNSFAEAVIKVFNSGSAKVVHWCCSCTRIAQEVGIALSYK